MQLSAIVAEEGLFKGMGGYRQVIGWNFDIYIRSLSLRFAYSLFISYVDHSVKGRDRKSVV